MFFSFQTVWARITLLLTLFSMVLAYVRNFSVEQIFLQGTLLLLLGRDTYCITTGKCNITSWTVILFPLAFIIFYGLEAVGLIRPKLSARGLESFRRFNQLDVDNVDKNFPKLVDRKTYLKYGNPINPPRV